MDAAAGGSEPITLPTALPSPEPPSLARRVARVLLALLVSLALAGLSLFLFTRHNDFPISYHPDEPTKVEQLRSPDHERNLNHPLLMIESADLARQAWGVDVRDTRQVAIAGRWASAILASVGVFAVCLLGFALYGWIGLAIVGPTIALCPPLLVYAHYLKEDASLIGGLSVTLLGAGLVLVTQRAWSQLPAAIVLGVGCAMAASGKYVGAAACVPALLTLAVSPAARWARWSPRRAIALALLLLAFAWIAAAIHAAPERWQSWAIALPVWESVLLAIVVPTLVALLIAPPTRPWVWPMQILLFGVVAVAAAVAINARAFEDPWTLKVSPRLTERVEDEYGHATGSHGGVALAKPNGFCLRVASGEIMPHDYAIAGLGGLAVVGFAIARRRWPVTRWAVVLTAFGATFAGVLAYDVIPFERYALPLTVLGYVACASLAAAGCAAVARSERRRVRLLAPALTAAVAATIIVFQGDRCLRFAHQFADDSRQRLREWLAANVPPGTPVLVDWYANLFAAGDPWRFPEQRPVRIAPSNFGGYVGSAGLVDRIAGRGIKYVIAVDTSYRRFFAPAVHAAPGEEEWFERTRAGYRDLFDRGELVWQSGSEPASNSYVDPLIRVYRVDRVTKPSKEPPPPPTAAERWLKMMADRKRAASQPAKPR